MEKEMEKVKNIVIRVYSMKENLKMEKEMDMAKNI